MRTYIYIFIISIMCSCASSRNNNFVEHKDSINIKDSTVHIYKYHYIDSVRWKDSISTIVDEQGNIKKQEAWHTKETISIKHDTATVTKVVNKYINRRITKKIYIKQKHSLIERLELKFGLWCFSILIVILLVIAVKHSRRILNFIRRFI